MEDASDLPEKRVAGRVFQAKNLLVRDLAIIEKVGLRELKVHYGQTEGTVCGDEAAEEPSS